MLCSCRNQEPQQTRLAFHRQIGNLVEKNRAAVCRFDAPHLAFARPREGAALVAEQLGHDEVLRHRAAIDRDKRSVPSRGMTMDR